VGRVARRAVLLDALGTLVELLPPGPALRRALAARGAELDAAAADAAMAAEIAYYRAHIAEGRDRAGLTDLRRRSAAALGEALPAHVRDALSRDDLGEVLAESLRFRAYPDAPAALEELRSHAARLVVVSNWDCSLHEVLAATGLAARVDGVVTSAEYGAAKPSPAIFAHALTLAGVPASDAVHVGDRLDEDVAGARAAGVEAILIARGGPPADVPRGVRTIASLRELADTSP
jgi:putative hydrolase of the HAD superfamily